MKQVQSILRAGCWVMVILAFSAAGAQGAGPGAGPGAGADPDTLFLTWFGDPTTSIVAQWLQEGEPLALVAGATDELPGFDVPKVADIQIDGDASDWVDRGFEAGFLAGDNGRVFSQADLNASAKLGWNAHGLLVLIQVQDDLANESDDPEKLWSADAAEVFISTGLGSDQRYQILIAPGADEKRDGPQQWFYDYRRDRTSGDLQAQTASKVVEGGYTVELLLPWSNLGIDPAKENEIAFQFYVDDRDRGKKVKVISWYPARDSNEQPDSMYALRLTDDPSPASKARAVIRRDGGRADLVVTADRSLAGKTIVVKSASAVLGEAVLREEKGRTVATIEIPPGPSGPPATAWGTITANLGGEIIAFARPMKWMRVAPPDPVTVRCETYNTSGSDGPDASSMSVATQVKPFGFSGMYVQRAAFDGLTPGGEYTLSIGDTEKTTHRFRTAPATLNEPVVFVDGGDVGTSEYVAPLHKIAAGWEPLFALIGGDAAYGNGRTPYRWVQYLRLWRENMIDPQGRLIPMLCAIGNHEVDGSFDQPREKAPYFLALFDGLYPEKSYAAVDFGDYLSLVLLDSGHLSAHSGEQANWLNQTLAERVDRPNLFTAYHVPAYPSHRVFQGKRSVRARKYWVPLFDRYGVDVSFEHHDHTYKRTYRLTGGERDPEGVLYMGDGCWGMAPRTVVTPEQRSYLRKSISSRHVIRVTLDGEGRQFLAVDEQGRVIDRYEMEGTLNEETPKHRENK